MAEFTKEAKQVIRQGRALEALLASEGWKVYMELLRIHGDSAANLGLRTVADCGEADGLLAVLKSESAKGVFKGLQLALTLPTVTVAQMKDILATGSEKDAVDGT